MDVVRYFPVDPNYRGIVFNVIPINIIGDSKFKRLHHTRNIMYYIYEFIIFCFYNSYNIMSFVITNSWASLRKLSRRPEVGKTRFHHCKRSFPFPIERGKTIFTSTTDQYLNLVILCKKNETLNTLNNILL